jgi:hypothetical protein
MNDFYLLQELKARALPLELNPTSNVRTGVCPSFAEHPLRRYFDAGLLVTLNSDDPAFFGSDLANEYLLAHTEQGFTRDELRQLARQLHPRQLPSRDSSTLRVIGWLSVGVAVTALGIFVGRELRKRYKFNHRTPYDFYSEAGKSQTGEFGLGI